MVDKEIINNIFDGVISNFKSKCHHTISEMQTSLKSMSREEKEKALGDILNDGQMRHYRYLRNAIDYANDELDIDDDNTYIDFVDGEIVRREYTDEYWEELLNDSAEDVYVDSREKDFILMKLQAEKELFQYERKIIEGYKNNNETSPINLDEYREDKQLTYRDDDVIGELEQRLIDKQTKIDFSDTDIDGCNYWFTSANINHEIYKSHDWQKLGYERPATFDRIHRENNNAKRKIDSVFEKLPSIGENIRTYRSGAFDELLQVGDTFKLKGYTSMTTQKASAEGYMDMKNMDRSEFDLNTQWLYTICVKGDNKVLVGNDSRFNNGTDEHELVLPRNIDATVKEVDYENRSVVIEV